MSTAVPPLYGKYSVSVNLLRMLQLADVINSDEKKNGVGVREAVF